MAEYIHVITATKVPKIRTGSSPFEDHGADPNNDPAFGSDQPTMFLPVSRPARPVINDITQQANVVTTVGDGGNAWPGQYLAGPPEEWEVTWIITAQDLDTSKFLKQDQLNADSESFREAGIDIGPNHFRFDESAKANLTHTLTMADNTLGRGGNSNMLWTMEDSNKRNFLANLGGLQDNAATFFLAEQSFLNEFNRAQDEIVAATDVNAVDAVTWSF